MSLTSEQLHDLVFKVTPELVKPEFMHLMDIWKAFLGGYVLPEMARQEPDKVAGNKQYEGMILEYSRDKILAMLKGGTEKIIEKIVERVVEKPVVIEKTVLVSSGEQVLHRRLRSTVKKIRRKERDLVSMERDLVIGIFNTRQDMLDKSSETCKNIIESINKTRAPEDKISSYQLAGYWSSLCRWGLDTKAHRDDWITKSMAKGVYSVAPIYSDEFVHKIRVYHEVRKEEAITRAKDHAEIKATGVRRKVIVSQTIPQAVQAEEVLDLSDIL